MILLRHSSHSRQTDATIISSHTAYLRTRPAPRACAADVGLSEDVDLLSFTAATPLDSSRLFFLAEYRRRRRRQQRRQADRRNAPTLSASTERLDVYASASPSGVEE